jgi:hypothetical protein
MIGQDVLAIIFILYVIVRHQGNFTDIGRNDMHGLGESRGVAAKGIADQFRPFFHGGAKVVDPRRRLTIKDVIRADSHRQKFLVQRPEGFDIIVDAFEKNRLVAHVDPAGKQVEKDPRR